MDFYIDFYGTADPADQSISILDENNEVLRSLPVDFVVDGACGGDAVSPLLEVSIKILWCCTPLTNGMERWS